MHGLIVLERCVDQRIEFAEKFVNLVLRRDQSKVGSEIRCAATFCCKQHVVYNSGVTFAKESVLASRLCKAEI